MHWLDGREKYGMVTFGVPWKSGEVFTGQNVEVNGVASQTKSLAFWPDGSIKWSSVTARIDTDEISIGVTDRMPQPGNRVSEDVEKISVSNGLFSTEFPRTGKIFMRTPYAEGSLTSILERRSQDGETQIRKEISFAGEIARLELFESGPLKTTVKISGVYRANDGSTFLRFILYVSIFFQSNEIQIKHTFLYDGEAATDFIKGVGIQFRRQMNGELYNRRVKIAGDCGILHETAQLLCVVRPHIGDGLFQRQLGGEILPFDCIGDELRKVLPNVTIWDSYELFQQTPNSFCVRKRTGKDCCAYIDASWGRRSKGSLYCADENSGIAVAVRDFFQRSPDSLHLSGLSQEEATLSAWLVSPSAEAYDMRHYDTESHQLTYYEGYTYVDSDPYGIAATSELSLFVFDGVASDETLLELAERVQKPPVLLCESSYYHALRVMGYWSMVERDTPFKAALEDELDKAFDFYKNEIEQRNWYGFWNYGDFMHTYDRFRHCWRYDIGGFAWQNTELVPTYWLWHYFLRTGREDVYTIAEAMSRHAADVDVYHFGRRQGLGSRHNVIHWGDSCKESRIGMAGHHRPFFYLSGGDFRIGDVFSDVIDADYATCRAFGHLKKVFTEVEPPLPFEVRTGPDWSSFCSNWMTEWERHGGTQYRDKIVQGIDGLKKAPLKMLSGLTYSYDPDTGEMRYIGDMPNESYHLSLCMGGPQVWIELADLLDDSEFRAMLAEYGTFYQLPNEDKLTATGGFRSDRDFLFPYMACTLSAYAAYYRRDSALAYKVWKVLQEAPRLENGKSIFDKSTVAPYFNCSELEEAPFITTNFTSQWCLNVIAALELLKEYMPEKLSHA